MTMPWGRRVWCAGSAEALLSGSYRYDPRQWETGDEAPASVAAASRSRPTAANGASLF